ncbi:hypothetical protein [Bosea sp. RAC05]|uniref:hypothetical protein n=1 Tax=Bosea sp. RAC05 TaxID=1842539 RepID=UPI00083E1A4F|nr:hypothetical protein [Bosea sp. RAC05]AOG03107.1 hypothetical protein BSY19_4893 [Bosea sp. RAC05]
MKTAATLEVAQSQPIVLKSNAQWLLRLADRIERLPGAEGCDAPERMRAAVAVSTRLSLPGEVVYERLRLVSSH